MPYSSRHQFEIISENDGSYTPACNSVEFSNTGAATVEISATNSSIFLVAGARKSFSSNHPEVKIVTSFKISFGTGSKSLTVVKEIVTKD